MGPLAKGHLVLVQANVRRQACLRAMAGAVITLSGLAWESCKPCMASDKILYLGGSPCAGKSSVADMPAARYGLRHLRLDDRLGEHIQSASADTQPTLAGIRAVDCDQIWLIPPEAQARRTIRAYIEEFPLHQSEIETTDEPLIVESAALLPCLLAPLLATAKQALYMVPTSAFQRKHYRLRPWVDDVLRDCSDPAQAFENWMQRDVIFARWVRRNALDHGLETMIVDGRRDIEATAAAAARHFGLDDF
jgi:hypothetical protein